MTDSSNFNYPPATTSFPAVRENTIELGLIGTLQELSVPLEQASVPHELVGGLAVFLHVENADSTHSSLTRDIDVMIRREDLPRVVGIAEEHGFRFRHCAGRDMLLYGETNSTRNTVRLLFTGEKG